MGSLAFSLFSRQLQFATSALEIAIPAFPQWASVNEVVLETAALKLRRFSEGSGVPVIVIAPYAGHTSCIADYAPGQSLIQTLTKGTGAPVYCTDWKSATYERRNSGIADYVDEIGRCVDAVGGRAALVGLCQGGWCAAMYAALHPDKVASLVIAGAPMDTQVGDGVVRQFSNNEPMSFFENMVNMGSGLMSGKLMLAGWKAMHPEKHIPYLQWLDRCKHVDDKEYLESKTLFSRWYEHTVDLPGRFYLEAIQWLFKENRLYNGTLELNGKLVTLANIQCPVYLFAGIEDDITPPEQVLSAQEKFINAESITVDSAPGGHLGLFMGKRALTNHWPKVAEWVAQVNRMNIEIQSDLGACPSVPLSDREATRPCC